MTITRDRLLAIMPHALPYVGTYLDPLNAAMAENGIDTPARMAAFLANVAVESGQLSQVGENLNYSADGLANTWPARFAQSDGRGGYTLANGRKCPNDLARLIERQPEKIANTVYCDRMGNGPALSGDGWTYRGLGLLELTGKAMQMACAQHFGVDPALIGSWLRSPSGASRSAAWYFASRGCNTYADKGDFDGVCDCINIGRKTAAIGDAIDYAARLAFHTAARRVLNA